ncbi:MAG: TonB-dependent receptor [Bacteroidota bacterium]
MTTTRLVIGIVLCLFSTFLFGQSTISGTITDKQQNPLIGVAIQVLNSPQGAVTDLDGNFSISKVLAGSRQLSISYLGYASQVVDVEVVANESSTISISLEESALQLDEIVVGAQKREERLQKVPLTISTANAEKIQSLQIDNLVEIGRISPTFNSFDDGGATFSMFASRGVFTIDDAPVVGIYVDDMPLFLTYNFPMQMADVERVEILNGPQGTLYGRNAVAGVIRVVSKKPTNETKGFVNLGYGNLNQVDVSAGLSGALVKNKLFSRISGNYNRRDGFIFNPALNSNDLLGRTAYGGNARLTFLASDQFSVTLQSSLEDRDVTAYALVGGFGVADTDLQQLLETAPYEVNFDTEGLYSTTNFNNVVKLNFQNDKFSAKAITTFQQSDFDRAGDDFDFSPFDLASVVEDQVTRTFTEEIRFSSVGQDNLVDWLGGLFLYSVNRDRVTQQINGADNALFAENPTNAEQYPYTTVDDVEQIQRGFSLFGNLTLNVTDDFKILAGLRFERETFDADLNQTFTRGNDTNYSFPALGAIPAAFRKETTFTGWSPKVGFSYELDDNRMLWANVAKGYRPGGVNPFTTDEDAAIFDEETSWTYELGLKSTSNNQRLRANLTAFYVDYRNQQLFTVIDAATFNFGRANLGQSVNYGLELESEMVLTKGLIARANLAYMESNIKEYSVFSFGGEVDNAGNDQGYSPRWSGNVGLNYQQKMNNNRLQATIDYQFQSDMFFDPENTIPQEGYGILNAQFSYTFNKIEIGIWGKNLADVTYYSYGYGVGGAASFANFGLPRTYGVSLGFQF